MSSLKLYVYDLSNGLARQLSLQMTGKQIDGIWHTSVVVFGQEIFYGQGICITTPGKSHHGSPMQIVDMGETALDEETFQQYIAEIREHYTADKYHLLDFNCNSFTNDCIGFLNGRSIPSWITDLPQDFLSTPFGAALRPTIDNMYRRPNATAARPSPDPSNMELGASLFQAVASQAVSGSPNGPYPTPRATPPRDTSNAITSPIKITTNLASLMSLISSHRCVTIFFTSVTCGPCRIVEPVFEDLAHNTASEGVAFAKVDLATGLGSQIAGALSVRATPTFLFFLDGKKLHELKGADAGELRTQVHLLIFQAFPLHPHASMSLPVIRGISLQPILYSQVPAWDAALGKLKSFIDADTCAAELDRSDVKGILSRKVIPFLRARFPAQGQSTSAISSPPSADLLSQWSSATVALSKALPLAEMFPLVDFWRMGLLDVTVSSWLAAADVEGRTNVTDILLNAAISVVDTPSASSRNLILTTLRLLSNGFANTSLMRHFLNPTPNSYHSKLSSRQKITNFLVPTLLYADAPVRTAAASLAFNIAAHYQRPLIEAQRNGKRGDPVADNENEGQGDWEVEIVSAVVEALEREKQSEEVVHRLTASLALFLHLSPHWTQLSSLGEVLQVKDILGSKLQPGGCGKQGVQRKEVKDLLCEVIAMCC